MKDFIIISSRNNGNSIRLISAMPEDAEKLRQWKNNKRRYFFHKEIINKSAQRVWMKKYFSDIDNFMFIVEYYGRPIGCMGFRRRPDGADIYNVILARRELARKGLMSQALRLLCSFIRQYNIERIYMKVLKSNVVAQLWYQKSHFKKIKNLKDAFVMEFQGHDIETVNVKTVKEGEWV